MINMRLKRKRMGRERRWEHPDTEKREKKENRKSKHGLRNKWERKQIGRDET